jgi:hypothetical protein
MVEPAAVSYAASKPLVCRVFIEGDDRNRTGVNGFAGRCVATPPRRQKVPKGIGPQALTKLLLTG